MKNRLTRFRDNAPTATLLGLLCAATVALSACGGSAASAAGDDRPTSGGDGSTNEADLSDEDLILAFYQCLRDNGVDVQDPDMSGGGGVQVGGPGNVDPTNPDHMAAVEECRSVFPDGRFTAGPDGGMGSNMASQEALIDFVDCIREYGFDMPDPDPEGFINLPEDFDPDSREWQSAAQDCGQHLDGGIRVGSPGGGGGMTTRGN